MHASRIEHILEEVGDMLVVYLKSGSVPLYSFIKDLNLNIQNIDQLIKIHFLMREEVKEFARELTKQIRNFKTSTTVVTQEGHGEIRGPIHWPATFKKRAEKNPNDHTFFMYNEHNRTYNIKENLVFKDCVKVIYSILNQDLKTDKIFQYNWFNDWKELRLEISDLYRKNIYLKRINLDRVTITDRMIQDTLKHRNALYRKAAKILRNYRRIMRYDLHKDEINQLLKDTFIIPDKEEVLFELYWVLKIIKENSNGAALNLVDGSNNIVAHWERGNYSYEVYHDSNGSKALDFNINLEEVSESTNPYLQQKTKSIRAAQSLARETFDYNINSRVWSGRPDILIEVKHKDTKKLKKVIIGEVKYTSRTDYAVQGIRELLDYMNLVKDKQGEFLDILGVEVEGILFVRDAIFYQATSSNFKVVSMDKGSECLLIL